MKILHYTLVLSICAVTLFLSACDKKRVALVNTQSGLYIHSVTDKVKTTTNGRLIKFGGDTTTNTFGPNFEFDKLR